MQCYGRGRQSDLKIDRPFIMTTNRRICRVRERKTIQDLIVIKVHASLRSNQSEQAGLFCFELV